MSSDFRIFSVGYGTQLISGMFEPIEQRTGFSFTHVIMSPKDSVGLEAKKSKLIQLRPMLEQYEGEVDEELLASLEAPGIPTINNMILSDRIVRLIPYKQAARYATVLAKAFTNLFSEARPDVVIGGFDGLHAGISLAVARKLQIPWYAPYLTTLPQRYFGFCSSLTPDSVVPIAQWEESALRRVATDTVSEFRSRQLQVAAYISANSMSMIVRRFPRHLRVLIPTVKRMANRTFDERTEYPPSLMAKEYVRKRTNLLRLPRHELLTSPPQKPYLLFGLHMQPESSLDTWAPFYTDQLNVVEVVARATPPTHRMLVKLHKSDGDNYSPGQLRLFERLPGVQLVAPDAPTRLFIENAALIVAIQGTMAIEGALLGKPVLMFGESPVQELAGVSPVRSLLDLPAQIRAMLSSNPPADETVITSFMNYLRNYGPGCYYDWDREFEAEELDNLAGQFALLRSHLSSNPRYE